MAAVELAATAVEDLDALIGTHSLPADTRSRVAKELSSLGRVPLMGAPLVGRWEGLRCVLGPRRWLLLVYVFIGSDDRAAVVTIQDGRSSAAATAAKC